jgi:hypothetical protein
MEYMNLENEKVNTSPKKQINITELANMMNKLSTIMSKNGEPMKSRAYQNAEDTLLGITGTTTLGSPYYNYYLINFAANHQYLVFLLLLQMFGLEDFFLHE